MNYNCWDRLPGLGKSGMTRMVEAIRSRRWSWSAPSSEAMDLMEGRRKGGLWRQRRDGEGRDVDNGCGRRGERIRWASRGKESESIPEKTEEQWARGGKRVKGYRRRRRRIPLKRALNGDLHYTMDLRPSKLTAAGWSIIYKISIFKKYIASALVQTLILIYDK